MEIINKDLEAKLKTFQKQNYKLQKICQYFKIDLKKLNLNEFLDFNKNSENPLLDLKQIKQIIAENQGDSNILEVLNMIKELESINKEKTTNDETYKQDQIFKKILSNLE
ncbi:hypothetical protein [Metamycoplasma hominis]|uniref:hypothetical protein n=1 Tax=Metamycoplasma hominis TaxID=2098 RepID=UPI00193BD746|nr:hypothetical protein [Metamycoplasma hominis]